MLIQTLDAVTRTLYDNSPKPNLILKLKLILPPPQNTAKVAKVAPFCFSPKA